MCSWSPAGIVWRPVGMGGMHPFFGASKGTTTSTGRRRRGLIEDAERAPVEADAGGGAKLVRKRRLTAWRANTIAVSQRFNNAHKQTDEAARKMNQDCWFSCHGAMVTPI